MEPGEKQIIALNGYNIIWWNMCSLITINGSSVYTHKFAVVIKILAIENG